MLEKPLNFVFEMYHDSWLLKVYVNVHTPVVFSHATDVMDSTGWKTLVCDQAHLIAEVFKSFLASTQTPCIGPPRKRQKTS